MMQFYTACFNPFKHLIAGVITMPKHQKTPYIHLTPDERCQIETILKRRDSKLLIAYSLNRSMSTIRREIFRNSGQRGYRKKQSLAFVQPPPALR